MATWGQISMASTPPRWEWSPSEPPLQPPEGLDHTPGYSLGLHVAFPGTSGTDGVGGRPPDGGEGGAAVLAFPRPLAQLHPLLVSLRLSDQGLVVEQLPAGLWGLSRLLTLDLSRNRLEELPDSVSTPQSACDFDHHPRVRQLMELARVLFLGPGPGRPDRARRQQEPAASPPGCAGRAALPHRPLRPSQQAPPDLSLHIGRLTRRADRPRLDPRFARPPVQRKAPQGRGQAGRRVAGGARPPA